MQITSAILKKIAPKAKKAIIDDLAIYLAPTLDKYGINTPLRVAHFLAQAAHESDGFKTLKEYWGPTAAQKKYEGRKDLGNTQEGDGQRFQGRGIFQLTGRANYATYGKLLGEDFEANPDQVATGKWSMLVACEYWKKRGINDLADHDDVVGVTKKINGGTNGLDQRIAYLKLVKTLIHDIMAEPTPAHPDDPKPAEPKPEPTIEEVRPKLIVLHKGENSMSVKIAQIALNSRLGTDAIVPDGIFGNQTEKAIIEFQKKNKIEPNGMMTVETYNLLITGEK